MQVLSFLPQVYGVVILKKSVCCQRLFCEMTTAPFVQIKCTNKCKGKKPCGIHVSHSSKHGFNK